MRDLIPILPLGLGAKPQRMRLLLSQQAAGVSGVPIGSDSRTAARGTIFAALAEQRAAHVAQARAAGATVLSEDADAEINAAHARWAHAQLHARSLGLHGLPVLGVTGTNGKTTICHLAWSALGAGAARCSTITWHDGVREIQQASSIAQTTPPAEELHRFVAGLPASCPGLVLEVSSHGAEQQRLAGVGLAGLAFSNLGTDHLDYHRHHAHYFKAKLRAVRLLRPGGILVVNAADARADAVVHAGRAQGARVIRVKLAVQLDASCDAVVYAERGAWRLRMIDHEQPLPVALPGPFNALNAAMAALLATAAGVALPTALARLAEAAAVPGRLERCADAPVSYVDYAHTAVAMNNVIGALRQAHAGQRLVIVFGCGGDRDRTKRAPMGRAALLADAAVLTTDNSRSESPEAIAADVLAGLPAGHALHIEADRGLAIGLARKLAGRDGVVAVLGKGHETEQIINGVRHPWDDRAAVRRAAALEQIS